MTRYAELRNDRLFRHLEPLDASEMSQLRSDQPNLPDAGTPPEDGMPTVIDAAPDTDANTMPDARIAPTGSVPETTGAAGSVSGSSYSLEFQIGHPHSQKPSSGGGRKTEGSSAVKP